MSENTKKNGFAGLSDLTSDLSAQSTNDKLPIQSKPAPSQEKKDDTNVLPDRFPWAIAIPFVPIIAIIIISAIDGSPNRPANTQNYVPQPSYSTSSASPNLPTTSTPRKTDFDSTNTISTLASSGSTSQDSDIQYIKPPEGTGHVLSVSQICWCLKEDIRLESMREHITSKNIDAFNRMVDDYNKRCSSYRYRHEHLSYAKRLVEGQRKRIESDAVTEAIRLGHSTQHLSRETIKEVQMLLGEIGYNPGTVDGLLGSMTVNAIKAFQEDIGIDQDGEINEILLDALHLISESMKKNDHVDTNVSQSPNREQTREAQRLLSELNYNPGPIDGQFGNMTSQAIKKFQQEHGLAQDGLISEELLLLLKDVAAKKKDA